MTAPCDYLDYLRDVIEMMTKIETFTHNHGYKEFAGDDKTYVETNGGNA